MNKILIISEFECGYHWAVAYCDGCVWHEFNDSDEKESEIARLISKEVIDGAFDPLERMKRLQSIFVGKVEILINIVDGSIEIYNIQEYRTIIKEI